MTENLLSKLNPEPLVSMGRNVETSVENFCVIGRVADGVRLGLSAAYVADKMDADLFCLAPDHALLLSCLTSGHAALYYLGPVLNLQVERVTLKPLVAPIEIGAFGCPVLTPDLRTALRRALGLDTTANEGGKT